MPLLLVELTASASHAVTSSAGASKSTVFVYRFAGDTHVSRDATFSTSRSPRTPVPSFDPSRIANVFALCGSSVRVRSYETEIFCVRLDAPSVDRKKVSGPDDAPVRSSLNVPGPSAPPSLISFCLSAEGDNGVTSANALRWTVPPVSDGPLILISTRPKGTLPTDESNSSGPASARNVPTSV